MRSAATPPLRRRTRRNNPSITICRISCMRPAPSDCRIAISRRRETNRTSVSVATLAHVSSSTTPAIASRIGNVAGHIAVGAKGRTPQRIQRDGVHAQMIVRDTPPQSCRMIVSRSCVAFSRLTPGRSLPSTFSQFALRCVIRHAFVPIGFSVSHAPAESPASLR